jgi:mono/diheme cytochrome c family protein
LRKTCAAAVLSILWAAPAWSQCGDFNDDGSVTAADALGILTVSVGHSTCDPYHCDVDDNGAITPTDSFRTLLYSVGASGVTLACPEDPNGCLNDLEFFFQKIWTPILTDCIACHNANGIANFTDHVLMPETVNGYLDHNFGVLRNLYDIGKGDLLLIKPQGIGHGGGQRLGITPDSVHYRNLSELLARFANPVTECGTTSDFWANVVHSGDVETLYKAAILFAGRRPTLEEEQAAARGDLRSAIRGLMDGQAFEDFLREAANDQFLTDKYLLDQTSAFGALQGDYQYRNLYRRIEIVRALLGDDAAHDAWHRTNRALAREPLELVVHIVTRERPYTEIVTADYLMVNPWSAVVYDTNGDLTNDWDDNTWQEGRNRGYRLRGYPHAGVLTSPMFLARFPSTATNRNRARARWAYKFFLGVDIEGLAPRTVNPAELDEADNPTMFNPNCTVCHSAMDPVAGTFQDFGDDGLYLENDTDSLPRTYKETDLYEYGDRWYRDMRAPGFAGTVMPTSTTDSAIVWLGRQIASDPRFARGAVEFWYRGLFGRAPLARPRDPTVADYNARLSGYVAQDEVFDDIAAKFAGGTAGTGRNGPFNLKDLLVELAVSQLFTASAAVDAGHSRTPALEQLGFIKLLTPEQLNRKFEGTTGARWARRWDPDEPDLLGRYRLFYGGIDSAGITKRATELNTLMGTVPQRLAYEMACPLAVGEFSKPPRDRALFPFVEPEDLPENPVSDVAIRTNIAWLHRWLLGEFLADGDREIEETYRLFREVRALRISRNKTTNLRWGSGHCEFDFDERTTITTDEHHTVRAWIAVLAYLLSDYRFLYE